MPRRFDPENLIFRYPEGASEEEKETMRKEAEPKVDAIKEMLYADFEMEKEPWQEQMIKEVSEKTMEFFKQELGLQVRSIEAENVHILDVESMGQELQIETERFMMGEAHLGKDIILSSDILKSPYPKLEFLETLIHEHVHNEEFVKMAKISLLKGLGEDMEIVAPERKGMTILKRDTYPPEFRFLAIDEGVTEIMAKKIFHFIVQNNPKYQRELDKKFSKIDEKVGREELFATWGIRAYDIDDVEVKEEKNGRKEYTWHWTFSYPAEQDLISFIVIEISKAKPEKYRNPDEAFNLFLRAQYRGELSPLGKEIDSTFGKGTFRLISAIPTWRGQDNLIARNALQFLRLPPEKRDPKLAEKYIFGPYKDDFRKYLSKQKLRKK